MRRAAILVIALASIAFLAGKAATAPVEGHASTAIGNGTITGPYAFLLNTHDPITSQEGAEEGTMVFNGVGGVSGVFSAAERCPQQPCGDTLVTRAHYSGKYAVHSDGSVTLDICVPTSTPVRVILQGAFSNAATHLRLLLTQIASPCPTGTLNQVPNVTTGTADKL